MEEPQVIESLKTEKGDSLVKKFDSLSGGSSKKAILIPAVAILLIILAGGATGYFLANRGGISRLVKTKELVGGAEVVEGPKEVGVKDEKTFRDTAEGKIEVNDNPDIPEGSHRLIRSGGSSQTAYLTSSIVDLNQFLGKCVQVWGETFAAQKAAWLMDVGRVKILDRCPEGV